MWIKLCQLNQTSDQCEKTRWEKKIIKKNQVHTYIWDMGCLISYFTSENMKIMSVLVFDEMWHPSN